jgi:hypothetical protein
MNRHLEFLLTDLFDTPMYQRHGEDLANSGITEPTRRLHKIRDVPVDMIDTLLGYHATKVRSAVLFPFADPLGGWLDYVKMKTFSDEATSRFGPIT